MNGKDRTHPEIVFTLVGRAGKGSLPTTMEDKYSTCSEGPRTMRDCFSPSHTEGPRDQGRNEFNTPVKYSVSSEILSENRELQREVHRLEEKNGRFNAEIQELLRKLKVYSQRAFVAERRLKIVEAENKRHRTEIETSNTARKKTDLDVELKSERIRELSSENETLRSKFDGLLHDYRLKDQQLTAAKVKIDSLLNQVEDLGCPNGATQADVYSKDLEDQISQLTFENRILQSKLALRDRK